MQVVVDNTAGGDPIFAGEVAQNLGARGLTVELREPTKATEFDTFVHSVTAGLTIRVSERPDRAQLSVIEEVVRAALMHRPSLRRRTRSVPVRLGETGRVIEWIDVFD
jgi:hypothetical protein